MDIDAFIRMLSGGGSTILAARADIENIPAIVQGTFPSEGDDGDMEIEALNGAGNPDGIDQIVFQVASFDLALRPTPATTPTLPYQAPPQPGGLFPADAPPASGNQYVHAVIDGSTSTPGARSRRELVDLSSQLQRIFSARGPARRRRTTRRTTRIYPDDNGVSDYTCIRADFDTDDEDRST